jgi:hypothetical protein
MLLAATVPAGAVACRDESHARTVHDPLVLPDGQITSVFQKSKSTPEIKNISVEASGKSVV